MAARAKSSAAGGLIGFEELSRAMDMIRAGCSDAAIAAAISASRPHGSRRVDPAEVSKLRDGA